MRVDWRISIILLVLLVTALRAAWPDRGPTLHIQCDPPLACSVQPNGTVEFAITPAVAP